MALCLRHVYSRHGFAPQRHRDTQPMRTRTWGKTDEDRGGHRIQHVVHVPTLGSERERESERKRVLTGSWIQQIRR